MQAAGQHRIVASRAPLELVQRQEDVEAAKVGGQVEGSHAVDRDRRLQIVVGCRDVGAAGHDDVAGQDFPVELLQDSPHGRVERQGACVDGDGFIDRLFGRQAHLADFRGEIVTADLQTGHDQRLCHIVVTARVVGNLGDAPARIEGEVEQIGRIGQRELEQAARKRALAATGRLGGAVRHKEPAQARSQHATPQAHHRLLLPRIAAAGYSQNRRGQSAAHPIKT